MTLKLTDIDIVPSVSITVHTRMPPETITESAAVAYLQTKMNSLSFKHEKLLRDLVDDVLKEFIK
jgi:hypothetical protein